MMRTALLVLACLLGCLTEANSQAGITPCSSNTISVTGTSSNVKLSACGQTVLLWNVTSQELFYNYGPSSSEAATTSGNSLPGNSYVVLNLGYAQPYLAAITATSTTTLRITQGQTR
jgi:hypothetical protein